MTQIDSTHLFAASVAKLQSLERRHHPEQGRYKELYIDTANCLRNYLHQQYGLKMKDCSMQELERILPQIQGSTDLIQGLREFFSEYERVESSQWLPTIQHARLVPARIRTLLTMLAPRSIRENLASQQVESVESQSDTNKGGEWLMPTPTPQFEHRAS